MENVSRTPKGAPKPARFPAEFVCPRCSGVRWGMRDGRGYCKSSSDCHFTWPRDLDWLFFRLTTDGRAFPSREAYELVTGPALEPNERPRRGRARNSAKCLLSDKRELTTDGGQGFSEAPSRPIEPLQEELEDPSHGHVFALIAYLLPRAGASGLQVTLTSHDGSWRGYITALERAGIAVDDVVSLEPVRA